MLWENVMRNTPTSFPAYWDNFVLQAGFLDAVTMACYNSIKLIISELFMGTGAHYESPTEFYFGKFCRLSNQV